MRSRHEMETVFFFARSEREFMAERKSNNMKAIKCYQTERDFGRCEQMDTVGTMRLENEINISNKHTD